MTRLPEKPGIEGLIEEKAGQILFDLVSSIPKPQAIVGDDPLLTAQNLIAQACTRAATLSAAMSLPGGPLGLLSTLPDIAGIWRIQAQLVADIASAYGKTALLQREEMIWCLFRHASAQLLRDLAIRTGRRILVQKLTSSALSHLLQRLGLAGARRIAGRSLPRLLPVVGAVASGAFAWYDTRSVGNTALDYFSNAEGSTPSIC